MRPVLQRADDAANSKFLCLVFSAVVVGFERSGLRYWTVPGRDHTGYFLSLGFFDLISAPVT